MHLPPISGAPALGPPVQNDPPRSDKALFEAAQALETNFLAEMLKSAGLGKTPEAFGGGAGEDQFASLLVREQAKAMTQKGGIGLAEIFYQTMKEKMND